MPTQERLKKLLNYDPNTGIFTHKKWGYYSTREGKKAGSVTTNKKNGIGYERILIDGDRFSSHRLAWLYIYGKWPENEIDHIDGDTLNNRINNLRDVTHGENQKNTRMQSNNKTGYMGVYEFDGKWLVHITVNKKIMHLGLFKNIDDAIKCRKDAEIKYGFHKNHGRKVAISGPK